MYGLFTNQTIWYLSVVVKQIKHQSNIITFRTKSNGSIFLFLPNSNRYKMDRFFDHFHDIYKLFFGQIHIRFSMYGQWAFSVIFHPTIFHFTCSIQKNFLKGSWHPLFQVSQLCGERLELPESQQASLERKHNLVRKNLWIYWRNLSIS